MAAKQLCRHQCSVSALISVASELDQAFNLAPHHHQQVCRPVLSLYASACQPQLTGLKRVTVTWHLCFWRVAFGSICMEVIYFPFPR